MLQFDCGLGSVIIYQISYFFCLVQFFFRPGYSEGAKKRVLMVCGNVQRKILCNWIDYIQSMNFMYTYWLYSSWTWKDEWEKVHPHHKLFISHDCHVQYRLYSNWTWKTGWKRMHPQALYFTCIKIANVWPVGPYLCGQIASQNRPVMGTCSIW